MGIWLRVFDMETNFPYEEKVVGQFVLLHGGSGKAAQIIEKSQAR